MTLLVFSAMAMQGQSNKTVTVNGMNYEITDSYAICKGFSVVPENVDTIKIPDEILVDGKSYAVEEIGQEAFTSEHIGKPVKHVVFPSCLKRIDGWSFINWPYCGIPDFLTSDKLILPESLESLGYAAFGETNIKSVYIPASLKSIGEQAFNGCKSLTSFDVAPQNPVYYSYDHNGFEVLLNIPQDFIVQVCGTGEGDGSFTTAHAIGHGAFRGCHNLKHFSVARPAGWSGTYSVGRDAFYNCTSLETIDFSDCLGTLLLDGVPTTQLYDEQTKSNLLRSMFGDLPALTSVRFEERDLPGDVVKDDDGIYYVLEKSSDTSEGNDCASVLFVPGSRESDIMNFSELRTDGDVYPILGVKSGAFSDKVTDVYFTLTSEQAAAVGQEYKVDGNSSSRLYHVPYPCTVDCPDGTSYNWMSYYDDTFRSEYKTIYFDRPFVMPEGLCGAVIAGAKEHTLLIDYQYEAGDIVPARTGLLLKKADEAQEDTKIRFHIYPELSNVTPKVVVGENYLNGWANNKFRGVSYESYMIPRQDNTWFYMLSRDQNHERIGFYWGAENDGPFWTHSNRAYLALPANMPSPVSAFRLDEQGVTGIEAVDSEDNASKKVYTLDGRRVKGTPLSKGIYVVNGQKVIVK